MLRVNRADLPRFSFDVSTPTKHAVSLREYKIIVVFRSVDSIIKRAKCFNLLLLQNIQLHSLFFLALVFADQIWLHRLNMPQNIESLNLPSRKKFLKASNLPKHYKSLKSLNLPERKKHFKSLDILKNKKSFNPSNLNLSKVELSDSGDITVQNLKTLKSKLSILQSLFSVKEMESFINPKLLQYLKLLNAEVPESQIGNNAALSSTTTSAEVKISTASNIALTNIKSMVARATAFKNSEKKLRSSKNQDKELDADFLSSSNLSILSESLYFKTLERVRNAYQAVLQSQLYTRDMLGHFSDGNLSPSLDKPQNLEMSNEVKAMHENLVPYEM